MSNLGDKSIKIKYTKNIQIIIMFFYIVFQIALAH